MILVGYDSTDSGEGCISKFKGELMKEFEMTDIFHMRYFLGIEFHMSKKRLLIHQRRYALEILKKIWKCKIVKLSLLLLNQGCNCRRISMRRMLIQPSIEG